jgi:hypothetical protein
MIEFLRIDDEGRLVDAAPNIHIPKKVVEFTKARLVFVECTREEIAAAEGANKMQKGFLTPWGTVRVYHTAADDADFAVRAAAHKARLASPQYRANLVEAKAHPKLRERMAREQAIQLLPAGNPLRREAERIEAELAGLGVRKEG